MADKTYNLKFTMSDGSEINAGNFTVPGGENGKSAYDSAVEGGYTGTEEEFYEDISKVGNESGGGSGGESSTPSPSVTDEEFLTMLNDVDILPAITTDDAILTDESGNILLW